MKKLVVFSLIVIIFATILTSLCSYTDEDNFMIVSKDKTNEINTRIEDNSSTEETAENQTKLPRDWDW